MVFNTITVGAAVTPTVIGTYFSHYLNRKPLHEKPTAHISYHIGLQLIRRFLLYSSHHTVEDVQAFTSQWVPNPRWVRTEDIEIPSGTISTAASHIQTQLGPHGVEMVGGPTWWQWRRDGAPLKAEWIEMRKDFNVRKKTREKCQRCMMYVHGGAYYFGSVDEHRYQMQRHARKLKARVLAPRYRLAPQFPFPCGLLDCLATYIHLLTLQDPSTIVLAGDSAGAGMMVSLMVILRDQGLPLPAGAILLSPWVDLTHSFPSVAGEGGLDYIPPHGFLHRPSQAWPPPASDEIQSLDEVVVSLDGQEMTARELRVQQALKAREMKKLNANWNASVNQTGVTGPSATPNRLHDIDEDVATLPQVNTLSATFDGQTTIIKDQIQLYTTNQLISHPLVSPILQPSLGGLPPLLVMVGGGEMLRDEQIYLGHKAANPTKYPTALLHLKHPDQESASKWQPTYVQLQVWDDLCHVAPTLSFTRPAKYMYRSVAQFGAWVLARAQKTEIRILDDDEISVISSNSASSPSSTDDARKSSGSSDLKAARADRKTRKDPTEGHHHGDRTIPIEAVAVGKAGDPLPPFHENMIRQRVTRHGEIYPLDSPNDLPGCRMAPEQIGVVKPGPVRKWLGMQKAWDKKFGAQKRKMQRFRVKEMQAGGYEAVGDGTELPPPTALAGRRKKGVRHVEPARKKSMGLALWSGMGSKHDEATLEREEERDGKADDGSEEIAVQGKQNTAQPPRALSRSRSRMRAVTDTGQTGETAAAAAAAVAATYPEIVTTHDSADAHALLPATSAKRPVVGNCTSPFKLGVLLAEHDNPSTATLSGQSGIVMPMSEDVLHRAADEGEPAKEGSEVNVSVPGGWVPGSSEETQHGQHEGGA